MNRTTTKALAGVAVAALAAAGVAAIVNSRRGQKLDPETQAHLDELEARVRGVFRQAAATHPEGPLQAMGAGFRTLVADGVVTGVWLQACATARGDDAVAARCRALIAGVLDEAARLTGAPPDDLAAFVANGALVVMLQALGVDLAAGSRAAVDALRAEGARS